LLLPLLAHAKDAEGDGAGGRAHHAVAVVREGDRARVEGEAGVGHAPVLLCSFGVIVAAAAVLLLLLLLLRRSSSLARCCCCL
jgi:hypothetical protein